MMEDKNLFADVNASKDKVTTSIRKTVGNALPYILLALIIIFRVLLEIFQTSIVNPFTPVFFLDTSISIAVTIFCYIVFIPQGEKSERLNSPSYKPNCARWGELSTKIRTGGMLDSFRKYCREQLEIERREIKAVIIGNNTSFSFEEYTERFSRLGDEELKALYESGELTKEEYKAIRKCNSRIKVKPINSVLILSGVARANYNDAGRDEGNYILRWLTKRPLMAVLFAIITRGITGTFIGLNVSVIYGMVLDTLSIIIASFVGYGAGEQAIRDKDDKIKNRILFIESFLEKPNNNGGESAVEGRTICLNTKEDFQ